MNFNVSDNSIVLGNLGEIISSESAVMGYVDNVKYIKRLELTLVYLLDDMRIERELDDS